MMPQLLNHFQAMGEKYEMAGPYLEVGSAGGPRAILSGRYFKERPDRFAINLLDVQPGKDIAFRKGNANDMHALFPDDKFRTVLSNAVLEHDRYFWRSIEEMKRVLAPGGILALGAPAFIPREQTGVSIAGLPAAARATVTYDVHARPDYWRFSRQAFQDVICEGLELLELRVIGKIPRLVAVARKPPNLNR
jgi:SAM-dependent methyltransferase